uniref:Uncharacterized protein n=1 Tax=Lepeophtheirus salmonis TaxID=72036 RepID=A0A0K2T9R0_LEPSM
MRTLLLGLSIVLWKFLYVEVYDDSVEDLEEFMYRNKD